MPEQTNASPDCCETKAAPATTSKKVLPFPMLALLSSISTIACCLPIGFLGALAAAGGGAISRRYGPG